MSRIDLLKGFVQASPTDPFPRYGLALELVNVGRLEEASEVFAELMGAFPEYVSAYLHAGNVLSRLGKKPDAAEVYRKGIEVSTRKGDFHARSELEAALAGLGLVD